MPEPLQKQIKKENWPQSEQERFLAIPDKPKWIAEATADVVAKNAARAQKAQEVLLLRRAAAQRLAKQQSANRGNKL